MCRTIAHGGARCDRAEPAPGSPASAAERAVTRAEAVAEQARDAFAAEADAALEALFTAVKQTTAQAERTSAVHSFLDVLAGAWHRVVRSIARAHERRAEALDARWRTQVGELLAQVRAERYAEERRALDHLHDMELHLDHEELLSRSPTDWLWRACREVDLMDLQRELDEEKMRLRKLEAGYARRPTPRVGSDIRQTQARVACWSQSLEGQRATLGATPHTEAEGQRRCSEAQAAVEAARAAFEVMRGNPTDGPTAEERAYLSHADLVAEIEHSRTHPEERVGRPVRS